MYEAEMWWFELFECARRLAITGMLIFVVPGTPTQIVVAMLVALCSVVVYITTKPFLKDEDDTLAIVTQLSIFFTLFGALLVRVEVDKTDKYDQTLFGAILIGVNLISLGMVVVSIFFGPVWEVLKTSWRQNEHDGVIKGLTIEHDENDAFIRYVETLALSSPYDSGFKTMYEELHGPKWLMLLGESKADIEWRNCDGNGPINEGRASFTVKLGIKHVQDFIINPTCTLLPGMLEHFAMSKGTPLSDLTAKERLREIARRGKLNKRYVYTARTLVFPLSNRDYLVESFSCPSKTFDGGVVVAKRSIFNDDLMGLKASSSRGYKRINVRLAGYVLRRSDEDPDGSTDVVYVGGFDTPDVTTYLASEYIVKKSLMTIISDLLDEAHRVNSKDGAGKKVKKNIFGRKKKEKVDMYPVVKYVRQRSESRGGARERREPERKYVQAKRAGEERRAREASAEEVRAVAPVARAQRWCARAKRA
jgi:hypothetical protein